MNEREDASLSLSLSATGASSGARAVAAPQARAPEQGPEKVLERGPEQVVATIGPSIVIRGEVTGDEDLIVHGRVEGNIALPQHRVVIGESGRIAANVQARVIEVLGTLEGDLRGDEQVTIRRTGNVNGNITSPRVSIEDGCRFRGTVEMDLKPMGDARKGKPKSIVMAADKL